MASKSFLEIIYTYTPSALHPLLKRIEFSDVGSRLARGVFWSTCGLAISRGLMLCATIIVARMLGKTGYGENPDPQNTGALGAALIACQQAQKK